MTVELPAVETRDSLDRNLTSDLVSAKENLAPPTRLSDLVLPQRHRRAFDWNSSVVIGMRGAGKSLWTAALSDPATRRIMAEEWRIDPLQHMDVHVAFGQDYSGERFPGADELAPLAETYDADKIWKTVVVAALGKIGARVGDFPVESGWAERVCWVTNNPEASNRSISDYDRQLSSENKRLLFVFDALDRVSNDWATLQKIVRGALRLALFLRMTSSIRAKLFLRPDMFDDSDIWTFADSSKLKQSMGDLSWSPLDLYAVIIQKLINDHQYGESIRGGLQNAVENSRDRGFVLKPDRAGDPAFMKSVIDAMAGPYMGKDARRGVTFKWIPNHLADANGRVSPRSMLLAFGEAARKAKESFAGHPLAIHYKTIDAGVAMASNIRVVEIGEEYPWVSPLLEPLRGLTVPCSPREITDRWGNTTIDRMKRAGKLPPRRFTTDPVRQGEVGVLIDDLVELAVLSRTDDGRINAPDIFRVSAGMKRRGGVPPAK